MKYIMFEDFSGAPIPIIFPNRIKFDEMREQVPYTTALSAGYVSLNADGFSCHGRSKGLNLDARPEDAEVISQRFDDVES